MEHPALTKQVARGADRAIYRQIGDHLREAIRAGVVAPGERMPSESQLERHYGVAKLTVRLAMLELRHQGFVEARHGVGVFVRSAEDWPSDPPSNAAPAR